MGYQVDFLLPLKLQKISYYFELCQQILLANQLAGFLTFDLFYSLILIPGIHCYIVLVTTRIFPDSLKIAKVTPIYKKGSKLECSNYRPISLLSNLDKIIEKQMHKRLIKFLNDQEVLYKEQFGSQKNFFTAHAIITLIENVETTIDNIFIDLQKAFDTIDHNILLHKFYHYGIRDLANNCSSSRLSNRKQFVSINQFNYIRQSLGYGVPQGSVVGPLLFLIYF